MAIALVNQATFDHIAANNDTLTYTSSGSGSGSLMVVFATRSGGLGTGAMTSVTDSAGNTWTRATRGTVSGSGHTRIECWYTYNYAAVTSISLNSATSQYYATNLTEWSGVDTTANPLDVASADGSGGATATTQTTPGVATTVAADLVIAAIHYMQTTGTFNSAGATPTTGWTSLTNFDSTTAGSGRAAYQVMSSTGTYSGSWTLGVSAAAGEITVSFKPFTGTSAPATEATASATADNATVTTGGGSISAPAAVATGSGVADNASVSAVDVAVATGVANNATVSTVVTTDAFAVVANGTGVANNAIVAISGGANPTEAIGIATAFDANVDTLVSVAPYMATRQTGQPVTQYVIYARNHSLQREGIIEDYQSANIRMRYNDVGTWELTVDRRSREAVWLTTPGWGIEVVMNLINGTQVPLIAGPLNFRKQSKSVSENKLTVSGFSDDILLKHSLVHPSPTESFPPYTGSEFDTRTGVASTVVIAYVNNNIGPAAIVPRRIPGLTMMDTDPLTGSTITGKGRWENLLPFVQGLANSGNVGFRIRQVGAGLEFQAYATVDHSVDVTLSELLGNLQAWEYTSEAPIATYVYIGGSGEGTARAIAERPDPTPLIEWGRREVFVDSRDSNITSQLLQAGLEYQADNSEKVGLSITPVDTNSCIYGLHYNLGDKVSIVLESPAEPVVEIVREVDISLTPSGPQVLRPIIGTPAAGPIVRMFDKFRENARRLTNLERR